ncbi:dephospho-CoA kinase [Tautonia sociabilis]|uniref:Dephospho-CoA kinase n=1 Tax=Tautonia sociabilis TaxID=2080755 RepID=A0A432MLN4_9BACT|nr:dephospho-CoA kinase [Tautonia sociabilis]RUL88117.1 dephospho-CoA kinase [Tautonia sociabilis]
MPRYARRPSGQRRPPGPWKNGPVPVVGLIGGIGAGKSLVAAALAARGAAVLDADAIGHALLDQRPARQEVVARFGEDVLAPPAEEGEAPRIDRKALGRLVFSEETSLRALEAILHPRMRKTFEKAIARISRRREAPLVVLDAAILLEAGWDDLCDSVVFVDAPASSRRERLARSREWSAEQLAAREAAQWPLDRKRARADRVVVNDGSTDELKARVDRLWQDLTRRPPWRGRTEVEDEPDDTSRSDATSPADRLSSRRRAPRSGAPRTSPPKGRGRRPR